MPAAIVAAIDVRQLYGLRTDPEYVMSVALNPAATIDILGIPLLPKEVADLRARAENRGRVWSTVEAYGQRHPDAWAGMYLDEAHGGDVVTWFTTDLAAHEAEIRGLVGPFARLRVESATWTLEQLDERVRQIEEARAWFMAAGAPLSFAEVALLDNEVVARVSSADPGAPAAIVEHFDGDGWLRVISDGVGPWNGGNGRLLVFVVDDRGHPVRPPEDEQWVCRATPDDPAAWAGGPGELIDGVCRFDGELGATWYTIDLLRRVATSEERVGHGTVEVVADTTVEVTIHLKASSP